MRRFELTDEQWEKIRDILPGREGDVGVTAKDNRLFLDAVLYVARTGIPWRDLPAERFGKWNSVFQRFRRWSKKGVWAQIMEQLQDPDLQLLLVDSTIIRAHQHAAGGSGGQEEEDLGRSRGGFSTKIHIAVNEVGAPVNITLSPGQEADINHAKPLLEGCNPKKVLADRGYDSNEFVATIEAKGAEAVIPPRSNRKEQRKYDKQEYKKRNLVERFINKIKNCRRVATRYDKTATSFLGFVLLAATMVLLA
jgi:transposase